MKPIPLILDTDIAGDADDVFALNLLLNSPEVSVELIITADEHEGHRARFAYEFVRSCGYTIPIVQGIDLGNTKYCHACRVGRDIQTRDIERDVVRSVLKVLRLKPETRYVCIAPQSNLALVTEALGSEAGMLNVVAMGGAINYRRKDVAEHNIRYDILAAQKVFASCANLRFVLSDTTFTREMEITNEHPIFASLIGSEKYHHKMMAENCRAFFAGKYSASMMHDPLTVATLWREDLVQFRETRLVMNELGQMSESPLGRKLLVSSEARYGELMRLLALRL